MLLACALLLIALATLWPMPGESQTLGLCIICGGRGLADLLLNIALFMPLGAALALRGRPHRPRHGRIILLALTLSTAIELSQFYIPGRDPSVSDVIANTCGALLGSLVVGSASIWLNPAPALATRLCRTATVLAALTTLATGLLLTPSFPDSAYYGLWTPELRHLVHYRGRVLSASLSGEFIGDGRITASDRVRDALRAPRGYELEIRAVVGPRPEGLSPLFAIVDEQQREILLVGLDRDDVVLRMRLRANDARLDRPDLRVPAWRGVRIGDTVSISIVARAGHYTINRVERGFTVGHGWALLLYLERLPFKNAMNAAWLGALFLLAGFWARARADVAFMAIGVLAGLLLVPVLTAMPHTPAAQWVAVALSVGAGAGIARRFGP
jgi:hypothetical protein